MALENEIRRLLLRAEMRNLAILETLRPTKLPASSSPESPLPPEQLGNGQQPHGDNPPPPATAPEPGAARALAGTRGPPTAEAVPRATPAPQPEVCLSGSRVRALAPEFLAVAQELGSLRSLGGAPEARGSSAATEEPPPRSTKQRPPRGTPPTSESIHVPSKFQ